MAVKVRNTVVNGGLSGIAKEIGKTFSYKQGQNHSTMKKAGAVNDKKSVAQLAVRSMFTQTSAGWSGLTEVQRSLWNAQAPNWTNTGIYGETKPSGKNLFTACNVALMSAGVTTLLTEPSNKALVAIVEHAIIQIRGGGEIKFDFDFSTYSADNQITVAVSSQKTAGTSKNSAFAIIYTNACTAGGSFDLKPSYEAKYGTQIAGKKMFYRINLVSQGGNVLNYSEGHIVF